MVDGTQIGVTHVFRSDVVQGTGDFGWTEVVKLASPAPPASKFGAALRMDGIRVFVGEIGTFAALTADEAQDFQAGAVWPFVMATQPWAFQDAALAGTGGEPCLMGSGLLEADSPTVVAMHHELVNTPTAFVIGFSAINAPFKGGVLVPQPTSVLWSATDPMGNISLNARWPNGVASGTNLYLQAWTIDLQVPGGFSATNGMHGVTP